MTSTSYGTREAILAFVRVHPGTHLREISRELNLPLGTALYHLDHLTRTEALVARRDGRYKRFFLRNGLGRREMDHAAALRHTVPRGIATALLARPTATQRELAREVGVSRSTLSFHVNRMERDGVVAVETRRPEFLYRLAEPDVARRLFDEYGASFGITGEHTAAQSARPVEVSG